VECANRSAKGSSAGSSDEEVVEGTMGKSCLREDGMSVATEEPGSRDEGGATTTGTSPSEVSWERVASNSFCKDICFKRRSPRAESTFRPYGVTQRQRVQLWSSSVNQYTNNQINFNTEKKAGVSHMHKSI